MSRWNPVADRVFNDSGFPGDHDSDSDKQEPDSQTANSLAPQSAKSGKSAAKAEKSFPPPALHVSYITRFKLLTPDVLTNLGLDLASVGFSDQQHISSTGCTT